MINELYIYACPKISAKNKNHVNAFHIIGMTLFSSFIALFGNIVFGIVVTALYLGLSLLAFMDKDSKSRYLKLIFLCVVNISVVCIYFFQKIYSGHRLFLWTIILGVIFFTIYEIIVFIKIRNRFYSCQSNNKKTNFTVSALTVFLFILIFKLLNRNPNHESLVVIMLIFLCSVVILGDLILVQKLVIYLMTRNKIQDALINKHDIT